MSPSPPVAGPPSHIAPRASITPSWPRKLHGFFGGLLLPVSVATLRRSASIRLTTLAGRVAGFSLGAGSAALEEGIILVQPVLGADEPRRAGRKFGLSGNRMAAFEPLPAIFPEHMAPIIKKSADENASANLRAAPGRKQLAVAQQEESPAADDELALAVKCG